MSRVALVVPGGVDRSGTHRVIPCLLWLIERLARQVQLDVFALWQEPMPTTYDLLGARVHNIGFGGSRRRATLEIAREHRRHAFDLLHGFWAEPSGLVMAFAAKLVRRPVLLQLLGGELVALPEIDYGGHRRLRNRAAVRLALRAATRLTTNSGPMQHHATTHGFQAERLPIGVALDRWPMKTPRSRAPNRPARLLWVGSLNRVKDPWTLLRAMAQLTSRGVPFSLDVVGEDTLDGEIHGLSDSLGLSASVRFHGFLPHADLRGLFEAADLLLVSSRHEGGPMVVAEAAIAGVPVVGTKVGWVDEWAPDAALPVAVADPTALADGVVELLTDEPRRLSMARAAQAIALEEDADWSAGRILEIYRELTAPRGRGAPRGKLDPGAPSDLSGGAA